MSIAHDGLTIADKSVSDDVKVRRYMSFSRFIWLPQKQQPWLSEVV